MTQEASAQSRPYIGFAYPAGGQRGTTFQVRLGGQRLDFVDGATVSGGGISAKVVDYCRLLGAQEITLLREQLQVFKPRGVKNPVFRDDASRELVAKLERRMTENVRQPACTSIANLVMVEVTIDADVAPGTRDIRVVTPQGVSNPLVFCVGQLPEQSRTPMITAERQVLGKEELALRKRPEDEVEVRITVPCTVNGQIASGEVNRYRFPASKGQRLVISSQARELVPFIADAVPGWFQPVMTLYDSRGREVAYDDDYRFSPDPVILYEVSKSGQYVLEIRDAIYRGREDFVYRVSIGETPFVTSIFPLGGNVGQAANVAIEGWNLEGAKLALPTSAEPGVYPIAANAGRLVSNRVPFALDTLSEDLEKEPNDDRPHAQAVELPRIVNGRIDREGDWDVFRIDGRAGQQIVAEVSARRLGSPLDSMLELTDAGGTLLASNDDHEDPEAGTNTHDADSYVSFTLPADGAYYVRLGDTARSGGTAFGYRLRLAAPEPDFALRIVPSSIGLRARGSATINVQVIRKDGFSAPIELSLKDPPAGFSARPAKLGKDQTTGRLTVSTTLGRTPEPVALRVEGRATVDGREIRREAVAAEDQMQAFLWRHLVPAEELEALVFNPGEMQRMANSQRRARPPAATLAKSSADDSPGEKLKFTKQQVAGRLRQLARLYDEGLLSDDFYARKVAECEVAE